MQWLIYNAVVDFIVMDSKKLWGCPI